MTALAALAAPKDGGCRILHLEDSPIDAELVASHLTRAGAVCTIEHVETRDAYAAALAGGGFDLVLADYALPDFNGLAALALARELAPDAPFIFVSGTLGEEAAVEAVKRGATDYVVKQRLARLPVAVERAMAEARARTKQRESQTALRRSEQRYRTLFEAMDEGFCVIEMLFDAAGRACDYRFLEVNPAFERHTDLREAVGRTMREFAPAHEEHWFEIYGRVALTGEPVRFENRAANLDGRWYDVYAFRAGEPGQRQVAVLFNDITGRKAADERQVLLTREVDHRAKNALAVVQSMLRLTRAVDMPGYVRAVEGRVAALARAQTLLARDRWAGTDLRALLEGELAPFLGAGGTRAALDGPEVSLPASAAQPLTMAMHELATNAVKYGALSKAAGCVSVSWRVEREPGGPMLLRLRWAEAGGPPVAGAPKRHGFGGRLLDGTVRAQLGGKVSFAWEPAGLVCGIEVPLGSRADQARPAVRHRLKEA
ncbi:HWE histidine kinase domain-containing protein [Belnapia sp. F-4-1]|uniref:HWE histidine kinase domain-containing protein n=1 Tax=Belnapia sp. F-4-1 TaxID=1545443 RepID=UPI00068CB7A1|nr:HWE histidine kinase domain-containing protein [Belnapia sp. F-4-1]